MITGLEVLPDYRGLGLSVELMSHFLDQEKQKGRTQAILTCLDDKVALYQKMGFTDLGTADSDWAGAKWHEMKKMI